MIASNPLSASLCRTGNPDHRAHSDRMPPLTPPSPSGRNATDIRNDLADIEIIETTIMGLEIPKLSAFEWVGSALGCLALFVAVPALLFIAEGISK